MTIKLLPTELHIEILAKLDIFTFIKCKQLDKFYSNLISSNIHLFDIDLTDTKIKGNINDDVLKQFVNAKRINLNGCLNFSCRGIKHLKGVREIDLSNCTQVKDIFLPHLSGVTKINLHKCNEITDDGLEFLLGAKHIDVRGCWGITNECKKLFDNVLIYDDAINIYSFVLQSRTWQPSG